MPSGITIVSAIEIMIIVPTIACRIPPEVERVERSGVGHVLRVEVEVEQRSERRRSAT